MLLSYTKQQARRPFHPGACFTPYGTYGFLSDYLFPTGCVGTFPQMLEDLLPGTSDGYPKYLCLRLRASYLIVFERQFTP
jgi:hypothetical protein